MNGILEISINKYFPLPKEKQEGKCPGESPSTVENIASTAGSYTRTGGSGALAFFEIVAGLISSGVGLTSEYFFKDSWIDKASKILSIGGFCVTGAGIYNLYKVFSGEKKATKKEEYTGIRVGKALSDECKEIENKIKLLDPKFFGANEKSLIRSNDFNKEKDLVKLAALLLIKYSNEEIRKNIRVYVGKDPIIEGVLGCPKFSQFKNRYQELLTFVSNTYDLQDKDSKKAIENIVQSEKINEQYQSLLPDDFSSLYCAFRDYNTEETKGDTENLISDNTKKDLILKLSAPDLKDKVGESEYPKYKAGGEKYNEAKEYLIKLQATHDFLSVVDSALRYVLNEQNKSDKSKTEYLNLVKSALITGFQLRSKNDNEIEQKLLIILKEANGVEEKLKALKKRIEDINQAFMSSEFPFAKKQYRRDDIELLKGIDFYNIEERI